jgi:hypothetical protein
MPLLGCALDTTMQVEVSRLPGNEARRAMQRRQGFGVWLMSCVVAEIQNAIFKLGY